MAEQKDVLREAQSREKFKTMIGGQALIEGILMQGPEKRAIVVRSPEGLVEKVEPLKKEERLDDMAADPRRGQLRLFDVRRREGSDVLGRVLPGGRECRAEQV